MPDNQAGFARVLKNRDVLVLSFGAMVGWSWVLLSGHWVLSVGSIGAAVAFLVGGGAITLIGLLYAELTSAMPKTGGEHIYMVIVWIVLGVVVFSRRASTPAD